MANTPLIIEGSILADKNYTHFAINKSSGKIIEAWNYKGIDPEELKLEKKHYFFNDIMDLDLGLKASDIKIIGRAGLVKMGLNPEDINSWDDLKKGGVQPAPAVPDQQAIINARSGWGGPLQEQLDRMKSLL